jgi:phospholipid N-methyltransferase
MSAATFAREFIRNWKDTGAIMPSSRALAHRMIEAANVPQANRVLELGPGTGAFTEVIHDCLPVRAQFLGLDVNPVFIEQLQQRFTNREFVCSPAQSFDFEEWLPEGEGFDAIVSGLPWAAFPRSLQVDILSHVLPRLSTGGCFATFAYWGLHKLPRGRHFRELLQQQAGMTLRMTSVVWRNAPPAFVYVLQRS